MDWAAHYIERLPKGETSTFRPRCYSRQSRIESGQMATVEHYRNQILCQNTIVLARVRGADYSDFMKSIRGDQVLIANAHGHQNEWTPISKVFRLLTRVGE